MVSLYLTYVFSDVLGMVNIYVFSQIWEIVPWMGVHGVLQRNISCACITCRVQFVLERRVHQVSLGQRVQTGTDPCVTC